MTIDSFTLSYRHQRDDTIHKWTILKNELDWAVKKITKNSQKKEPCSLGNTLMTSFQCLKIILVDC